MQVFLDAVESVNLLVNSNGTVRVRPHGRTHGGVRERPKPGTLVCVWMEGT
jgi:hypothetical protein